MKKFIIIVCAGLALSAICAEQLAPKTPDDFLFGEKLSQKGEVLTVESPSVFYSKERLAIDTAKSYRLSGKFRASGNKGGSVVRFGVVPHTQQQQITPKNINIKVGTETELVSGCSAEDKILKVKDASKWQDSPLNRIAFDIDSDGELRDLPNFNVAACPIKKITKKADFYEVELADKCGVNFAEGTPIRLHNDGWILIFAGGSDNKLSNEWQLFAHTFEVGTVAKDDIFRWWKGTELAGIYIDCLTDPNNNKIEFKNIVLEEVIPAK